MATDKKRVIVYVDEELKNQIDQIAHRFGSSTSRLCGDVLESAIPALDATSKAMETARTDPQKALEMIRSLGADTQGDLLKAMEQIK